MPVAGRAPATEPRGKDSSRGNEPGPKQLMAAGESAAGHLPGDDRKAWWAVAAPVPNGSAVRRGTITGMHGHIGRARGTLARARMTAGLPADREDPGPRVLVGSPVFAFRG